MHFDLQNTIAIGLPFFHYYFYGEQQKEKRLWELIFEECLNCASPIDLDHQVSPDPMS
jgi:hypothetical protein